MELKWEKTDWNWGEMERDGMVWYGMGRAKYILRHARSITAEFGRGNGPRCARGARYGTNLGTGFSWEVLLTRRFAHFFFDYCGLYFRSLRPQIVTTHANRGRGGGMMRAVVLGDHGCGCGL